MAHLLLPKTPSTATEEEENEKLFRSSLIFLSLPLACTQKTNPTNTAAATATLPQPTIQLSYRPSGVFLSSLLAAHSPLDLPPLSSFFPFRPRPTTTELPTVGRADGQSQLRALLLPSPRLQFWSPPLSAFEEDPSCLAMGGSRSSKKRRRRRRRRRKAGVQAALTLPYTQIAMTSFGKQRTHC